MKADQPRTFFVSYHCRLSALAEMHGIKPSTLKVLIEDGLRKRINRASEREIYDALVRVAALRISLRDMKFLFNRTLIVESSKNAAVEVVFRKRKKHLIENAKAFEQKLPKVNPPLPSRAKYRPETPVDAVLLEQAWKFIESSTVHTIESLAFDYGVPVDALEALVCDRFIFRRTGWPPCPIEEFVEYANEMKRENQPQNEGPEQPDDKDQDAHMDSLN